MILRALFWIGVVSVLMPREPDLGLGRPGGQGLTEQAQAWVSDTARQPSQVCNGRERACAAGLTFLDSLQGAAVRSLAQVKADIEAAQRARSQGG
jgi:hypothetical protein